MNAYYLLKYIIRSGFLIFFRKVYFTGSKNIPRRHSIVFAVNHPTAFLDPIAIASMLPHELHFMLRGDIFTTRLVRWFLKQIKTIPIFRFRDGFSSLKNNQNTFEIVYDKLNKGDNILILAEGIAKHEKKMRPIQKGTARMVFGTYEKHGKDDIIVIPVGVNYTDSDAFRSFLMVDFGKPLPMSDYMGYYAENPRKAVKKLTEDISAGMSKRIVHIEKDEDAEFTNILLDIQRNNRHTPVLPLLELHDHSLLDQELALTQGINAMEEEAKSVLKKRTLAYRDEVEKLGLEDLGLAQPYRRSFRNSLILLIGLIPFILGYLLNFLPFRFAKYVADQKVTKIEFHSSVRFGVGAVGYTIYWIIAILLGSLIGGWTGFAWAICMPIFGFFALNYRDFYQAWRAAGKLSSIDSQKQSELQKERQQLLQQLQQSKVVAGL